MTSAQSGCSHTLPQNTPETVSVLGTLIAEYRRLRRTGSSKSARLFALRSLWAPVVSARWVTFLHAYHQSLTGAEPAGIVINKPLRNYLVRGLGPTQRVRLLIEHYEISQQLLPAALRARLTGDDTVTLGILRGNRGTYAIKLAGSRTMHTTHEGEIVLFMEKSSDGCILAKATFIFARQPDGRIALVIGGLQGVLGGFKHEVVDATRSLSNLRPKDVVLVAIQAFADQLGIGTIHAVGNRRHVIRAGKNHKILADYDVYWMQRGGERSKPYGFSLPVAVPRTGAPTNKREAHKKSVWSMVAVLLDPDRTAAGQSNL